MVNNLVFPDGVRFATEDELPGPESDRSEALGRINSANITPGFVLRPSGESPFSHYAEINVDAHKIWAVFSDLCQALLGPVATFLVGEIDDEPVHFGPAGVPLILTRLEPYKYRLANDGFLQYGLVSQQNGQLSEIFVHPTKHFSVWLNDEMLFGSLMERHDIHQADYLEFLDQYPRTTVPLPPETEQIYDSTSFIKLLSNEIVAISERGD